VSSSAGRGKIVTEVFCAESEKLSRVATLEIEKETGVYLKKLPAFARRRSGLELAGFVLD